MMSVVTDYSVNIHLLQKLKIPWAHIVMKCAVLAHAEDSKQCLK
jgi:hypothetical protein